MADRSDRRNRGQAIRCAALAMFFSACASEGSEAVQQEIRELEAAGAHGVQKVARALADPTLTFAELGDGLRLAEGAARALESLAGDERASNGQKLAAVVARARIWDDVALAFVAVEPPAGLEADQEALFRAILEEKAFPAQISALAAYDRALELVCADALVEHPAMLEILDGLQRYRGKAPPAAAPCAP